MTGPVLTSHDGVGWNHPKCENLMRTEHENLINIIHEEILRFLNTGDFLHANPKFRIVFLLSGKPDRDVMESAGLREVVKRYSCLLVRSLSFMETIPEPLGAIPEIPPKDLLTSPPCLPENVKAFVLFQPELSFIARTALGTGDEPDIRFIHYALTSEITILGIPHDTYAPSPHTKIEGNISDAHRARSSRQSLYRQYQKTLENWGVVWIPPQNLSSALHKICGEDETRRSGATHAATGSKKRLIITKEDVEDRIKRGERDWFIPPDAIITDIARETADQKGLNLKQGE